MSKVKIELKQLQKSYVEGETATIKGFDLLVYEGEFIVFVGPSGCGKSTTLRMIAGIESITAGELKIDGKRVNEVPAKDREVAMVFQNYALYPHMTVFDNIAFGLKVRKEKKEIIKEKVNHAVRILGLQTYLKKKPKDLSGGQRQRVALGRAIVRDADIFLMDEPLSNLDAKLRNQMRTEIIDLHRKLGATTIYVTHDQTEAMTMASRIVVLKDGIVQQIGTPGEIYHKPTNVFVASFMGSPQMNFLNGRCDQNRLEIKGFPPITLQQPMNEQRDVIIGIRPEGWKLGNSSEGCPFHIQFVELLGADVHLHGQINEQNVIVRRSNKEHYQVGDTLFLCLEQDAIHLFDLETKKALFHGNK